MPKTIKRTTKDGKPAYKWGDEGKAYTYKAGDKESRERAKRKAQKQGRSAYAGGYNG